MYGVASFLVLILFLFCTTYTIFVINNNNGSFRRRVNRLCSCSQQTWQPYLIQSRLSFFSARCVRSESSRYCHDVRPSVRLSGTGVHCDYTVHYFSADLVYAFGYSNVLGTLTPKHVHLLIPFFFFSSLWKRGKVCTCKLSEELNANNDKYVMRM